MTLRQRSVLPYLDYPVETQTELGRRIGISQPAVSRLIARTKRQLRASAGDNRASRRVVRVLRLRDWSNCQ